MMGQLCDVTIIFQYLYASFVIRTEIYKTPFTEELKKRILFAKWISIFLSVLLPVVQYTCEALDL